MKTYRTDCQRHSQPGGSISHARRVLDSVTPQSSDCHCTHMYMAGLGQTMDTD